MLDCLRSRSCSEFQACTCNIIYKSPTLEKQKRLCVLLSHGTVTHGLSKQLPDTKYIQASAFLGLWNFPMKNRSTKKDKEGFCYVGHKKASP